MRRIIQWTVLPVAIAAVACGKTSTTSSSTMSDDLKRDITLASQTQNLKINPDEVAPQSRQALAMRPKAASSGPKVVRTKHPTVKASAVPAEVAELPTDIPRVQVMASAPTPAETPTQAPANEPPPLARPSPVSGASYPGTTPGSGAGNGGERGQGGGTAGGIFGGIIGAVIRGGIVGGDDHCDPRGGRGRPVGGDVYIPRGTGGMMGGIGGMAGGRTSRGRP